MRGFSVYGLRLRLAVGVVRLLYCFLAGFVVSGLGAMRTVVWICLVCECCGCDFTCNVIASAVVWYV